MRKWPPSGGDIVPFYLGFRLFSLSAEFVEAQSGESAMTIYYPICYQFVVISRWEVDEEKI